MNERAAEDVVWLSVFEGGIDSGETRDPARGPIFEQVKSIEMQEGSQRPGLVQLSPALSQTR